MSGGSSGPALLLGGRSSGEPSNVNSNSTSNSSSMVTVMETDFPALSNTSATNTSRNNNPLSGFPSSGSLGSTHLYSRAHSNRIADTNNGHTAIAHAHHSAESVELPSSHHHHHHHINLKSPPELLLSNYASNNVNTSNIVRKYPIPPKLSAIDLHSSGKYSGANSCSSSCSSSSCSQTPKPPDSGGLTHHANNNNSVLVDHVENPESPGFVPTPPPPPSSSKLPPSILLTNELPSTSSAASLSSPSSSTSTSSKSHKHHHHKRKSSKQNKTVFRFPKFTSSKSESKSSSNNEELPLQPLATQPSTISTSTVLTKSKVLQEPVLLPPLVPTTSKDNTDVKITITDQEDAAISTTASPATKAAPANYMAGSTFTGYPGSTASLACSGGLKSKKLKTLIHPLDRSIVGIFTLTIFFTILAILTGAPTVLFLFLLLPIVIFLKKLFLCHFTAIPHHEPLSSIDSFWLATGHITHCVLYVDKGLSVQQLRDVISSRLLSKPELGRFKSKLVYKGICNTPYWKYEPKFDDVDEHVMEDEPIVSKKELRQRLMNLMGQTLPTSRPLWQIRYAAATFCNQVILIVRCHQALSQSGLVSILTHYLSDAGPVQSTNKPRFGGVTLSINIFRAIIVGPLTFFLWLLWAFTRRHHNYLTKSKDIESVHWISLDLPRVYRIKQVTRSSLNDVIISSIAGSIRAYLTSQTTITNPPDLTVSIPIDIKPSNPIESSLVGVNYVLTTSPIPTNTEGAIPRLWEVRHLMEELKTSADTAVMYGAHYLLNRLLPRPLYRFLINLVNRNSSVYVSNIQGPEQELSIGSHRLVKAYYFLSPPSYCSIVYNIFTFNDKLYLSISSRSKLIPNARILSKLFRAQIDLLHVLLSRRRVPGESKRAKRAMFLGAQAADQLQAVHAGLYQSMAAGVSTGLEVDVSPGGSDLSNKLHEIQDELNRLSDAYDMGEPGVASRYEELKEEFTSLLFEMRRRKSIADYGQNIMINIENEDDDENDGELRPPPRRFSVVSIGRRGSIVSSLPSSSRVTPPILSRRSVASTSPEPPSSPDLGFARNLGGKLETDC